MDTKISKEVRKKIKDVLEFVLNNPYSNFYKRKYQGIDIEKILKKNNEFLENFQEIPFLTKDEILETPLEKRTFCPKDKVFSYFVTSGTTKNKKIGIVPFSKTINSFTGIVFAKEKMKKLGVSSVLFLAPANHGLTRQMIFAKDKDVAVNFIDMNKLELAGKMIKEIGIEGIATMPTVLESSLPFIKEVKVSKNIKWIIMTGEFCTQQKREYFQKIFPNAYFDFIYGFAEAPGLVAYRCEYMKNKNPNLYHPILEKYIEIVDENGNLTERKIGELVVTNLTKNAFPLIRYRSGDMAVLKNKKCRCGNHLELEILGRADFDFLKFQGITLHIKAVENALVQFNDILRPIFLMEVFEKKIKDKVIPELKLKLVAKEPITFLNLEEMADRISRELQVSSTKVLKDLIKQGTFLPLKVEFVSEIKTTHFKTMSIISHLDEDKK